MRLSEKTIIVTGAAGAQGAATAHLAGQEGANLVLADASQDRLERLSASLDTQGIQHSTVTMDVTHSDDWEMVTRVAIEKYGSINGLAHFAAALSREGVLDTDFADWDQTIKINLTGTWLGFRAVIPEMQRQGGGSIVALGSIDSVVGRGGATAYQASKGGVRLLAKSTATEVAKWNVRVNCVHPGPMAQPMNTVKGASGVSPHSQIEDLLNELRDEIPLGRLGAVEDIAPLVVFLLSDDAGFITGADFMVDGGLTAQ